MMFEKDLSLAKSDVGLLADGDETVDVEAYNSKRVKEREEGFDDDEYERNEVLDAFSDEDE